MPASSAGANVRAGFMLMPGKRRFERDVERDEQARRHSR